VYATELAQHWGKEAVFQDIEQESSTVPDMQQEENNWILVDRENFQLSII
jgi:hypothetical protein